MRTTSHGSSLHFLSKCFVEYEGNPLGGEPAMFKLIVIAGLVVVGAAVSTALAVTQAPTGTAAGPRIQIDPAALTLTAGPLPALHVDRAF